MAKTQPSIAIVHDYLAEFGGAERVVLALSELFPEAPIYTAFVDQRRMGSHWHHFADKTIKTTWLQRIPGITKLFSPLRFLAKSAFEKLDLSQYDVVISSSNAYFAKAVRVPNGKHICYCHTPPRALYGYNARSNWQKNPITYWLGTLLNHVVRVQDFYASQAVDTYIANSKETQRRIKKFYRRDSLIIHPPVAEPKMPAKDLQPIDQRSYYLYVNRLNFAKHPEIAVQACSELNLPLKVVGSGAMLPNLEKIAGESVEFLGSVDDAQLHQLYAGAKALLYPVEDEDFGMVPVEAMSYGTPVLAHNSGGPRETILPKKTGLLFDDLSVAGLRTAITQAQTISWKTQHIAEHAEQFSTQVFGRKILDVVQNS